MENKKYEQLIDLIVNEQDEKARELFHEIVVEKSREIYESMMDEEMMGEQGEEMVGEVGDLMDEISAEESGDVVEAEDDADIAFDDEAEEAGDEMTHDMEDDHDEEGSVEKADLGDIKDKLDDLMAEFEALMSGDEGSAEVGGDEEMMEEASEDEEAVEESAEDSVEEEEVMEAVQLKKVPGLYGSKIGGDDGANTKSPTLTSPKVKTAGVNPVKFSGDHEAVPTGPKGPSNYGTKGEKEVPGAGNFKNAPGKDNFKEKGESAPKPVTSQASGVNNKSPVSKG